LASAAASIVAGEHGAADPRDGVERGTREGAPVVVLSDHDEPSVDVAVRSRSGCAQRPALLPVFPGVESVERVHGPCARFQRHAEEELLRAGFSRAALEQRKLLGVEPQQLRGGMVHDRTRGGPPLTERATGVAQRLRQIHVADGPPRDGSLRFSFCLVFVHFEIPSKLGFMAHCSRFRLTVEQAKGRCHVAPARVGFAP
jgi:hypothetical protein